MASAIVYVEGCYRGLLNDYGPWRVLETQPDLKYSLTNLSLHYTYKDKFDYDVVMQFSFSIQRADKEETSRDEREDLDIILPLTTSQPSNVMRTIYKAGRNYKFVGIRHDPFDVAVLCFRDDLVPYYRYKELCDWLDYVLGLGLSGEFVTTTFSAEEVDSETLTHEEE